MLFEITLDNSLALHKLLFARPLKSNLLWLLLTHSFHPISCNKRAIAMDVTSCHFVLSDCPYFVAFRPKAQKTYPIFR